MAIAIISSPNTVQPAFNQMVFDVSSTNAGQANFNFLCDVYNGSALVSRLQFPKQPSVNTCKIDISQVIKNYVTHDLSNVYTTICADNTNSRSKYYCQFGEVYDVSGIPTTYANLTRNPTSGSKQGVNSVFDFEDFTANIMAAYDVSGFGFLTEIPETIKIKSGQQLYLTFYDPLGVVTDVEYIVGPGGSDAIAGTSNEFLRNLNGGWWALQHFSLQSYAVSNYAIRLLKTGGGTVRTLTVNIDNECSKFDTYRLHWLNHLGGWDAYNFTKSTIQRVQIERKQFKKIQSLSYSIGDRLKTNYNTTLVDEITINSDWMSDTMAAWIEGLFTSPLVFLERPNGDMIAVNITDSIFEVKKYLNGRTLHNVSLTFEYSYNRYRQSL